MPDKDGIKDSQTQVWFKSDLRVDDHPGLHLASKAASILPVFCFDPKLHTHLLRTPNGLEGKPAALLPGSRHSLPLSVKITPRPAILLVFIVIFVVAAQYRNFVNLTSLTDLFS